MNARTTLSIAFLVSSNLGCAHAQIKPCAGLGSSAQCPDANGACHVNVTLTAGPSPVPEVNPYTVLANPRAGNFHIVWHLPQGAHFNPAKGDGIFLKNDDQDQFSMNYATDDQAGFPSTGKKGKNYHWQFDNSKRSQYQYLVRFRMGTTVYECDPLINNEGG